MQCWLIDAQGTAVEGIPAHLVAHTVVDKAAVKAGRIMQARFRMEVSPGFEYVRQVAEKSVHDAGALLPTELVADCGGKQGFSLIGYDPLQQVLARRWGDESDVVVRGTIVVARVRYGAFVLVPANIGESYCYTLTRQGAPKRRDLADAMPEFRAAMAARRQQQGALQLEW